MILRDLLSRYRTTMRYTVHMASEAKSSISKMPARVPRGEASGRVSAGVQGAGMQGAGDGSYLSAAVSAVPPCKQGLLLAGKLWQHRQCSTVVAAQPGAHRRPCPSAPASGAG